MTTGCVDMSVVFQEELAAARAKLQASRQEEAPSQPSTRARSSLGHRAGFDAFMTGYAFACYALQSWERSERSGTERGGERRKEEEVSKEGGRTEREGEESAPSWPLGGVAGMRNTLPSRARNWKVPLHILKSHFTKTSSTHTTAKVRMRQLASLHTAQEN